MVMQAGWLDADLPVAVQFLESLRHATAFEPEPDDEPVDLAALAHAIAERLDDVDPSHETGMLLDRLTALAPKDDFVREMVLRGWDRQRAWIHAKLYGCAQPMADTGKEWSKTEAIRSALGISRYAARNIQLISARLFSVFPDTLEQLRRGRVSQGHVWALMEMTRDLDDDLAGKVEDLTFADAPHQTIAEYRRALDKARLLVDPNDGERRHKERVASRGVNKWTDRDGVSKLLARMPAEDLAAAYEALVSRAETIKQEDDPRGLSARMADALTECLTGFPAAYDPRRTPDTPRTAKDFVEEPTSPPAEPASAPPPAATAPTVPAPSAPEQPAPVEIHVVVAARKILAGLDDSPRTGPGYEQLSRAQRRQADRAAKRASKAGRVRVMASHTRAVVGLDAFMGRRKRAVGDMTGYGAVPLSAVLKLAEGDVVIRRLVVNDDGLILDAELTIDLPAGELPGPALEEALLTTPYRDEPFDYGVNRYRPPAAMLRKIVLRDVTCTVPGCGVPAWRCDCDHANPFPTGPTSEANCGSLCRWHHRLKTHAYWHLVRLDDGSIAWTSPAGVTTVHRNTYYMQFLS